MARKVDEYVNKLVAELEKFDCYMIKGSKSIKSVGGRRYSVAVTLQTFVDEDGHVVLIREV